MPRRRAAFLVLAFCAVLCNALIRGDNIDDALKMRRPKSNVLRDAPAGAPPSLFLDPVFLRIVDDDFIELAAGNPGHMTKLRLNFSLDEILIYEPLSQRSQTFDIVTGSDGSSNGSEIFYLERYKLRLRFRFAQNGESVHSALYHTTPHAGVVGLGAASPLWTHWDRYTLTGDLLILGGYDAHLPPLSAALPLDQPVDARISYLRLQDAGGSDARASATLHGALRDAHAIEATFSRGLDLEARGAWRWSQARRVQMRFTLADPDARLLPDVARAPYFVAALERGGATVASLLVGDALHRLATPAGFGYYAMQRDAAPGDTLQLGAVALRRFTLHVDAVRRTVRLAAPFAGTVGARLALARESEARGAACDEPLAAALDVNLVGMFALLAAALAWLLVGADAAPAAQLDASVSASQVGNAKQVRVGSICAHSGAFHLDAAKQVCASAQNSTLTASYGVCAKQVGSGARSIDLADAYCCAATQVCTNLRRAPPSDAYRSRASQIGADAQDAKSGAAPADGAKRAAQAADAQAADRLLALLQVYVYVVAPLLFCVNVAALDAAPLVEHYARASAPLVLGLLGAAVAGALVLGAAGAVFGAPAETRRGALVLAASATLWLVALPRHADGGGAGAFMMFLVGAAAACGAATDFLAAATRRWRERAAGAGGAGWLVADAALVVATSAIVVRLDAYPLVRGHAGAGGIDAAVPTLFLWTVFVLAPAFAFHLAYEMRRLR